MGYMSDVALAIREQDYELLREVNKENKNLIDLLDRTETVEYDGVVVLHWYEIKWYNEFPEVQAIEEFIYRLADEDKPYKFIRVGEDTQDIEVDYSYGDEEKYESISYRINDIIGVTKYINIQ